MIRTENGYTRCKCQRELIVENIFKYSGMPKTYFKYKSELEDQKILNQKKQSISYLDLITSTSKNENNIKRLIREQRRIVLRGNPGTGKSQLAGTIAIEIAKVFDLNRAQLEVNQFFFLDVRKIGNLMFNGNKNKLLEKIKKCNVLIIDDLGKETKDKNGNILLSLDEIVRSFEGLIIVTTNDLGNIKAKYDKLNEPLSSYLLPNRPDELNKRVSYYHVISEKGGERRNQTIEDDFLP